MGREAQATGKALIVPGLGGTQAACQERSLPPAGWVCSPGTPLRAAGVLCWRADSTAWCLVAFCAGLIPPLRAGFAHFGAALLSSILRLSSKKQTARAIPAYLQTTPPQAPNPVTSPHSPRHRLQQGRCPGPGSPWCCRRAQPGAAAALSSAARPRSAADLQLVFSLIYVTAYLCPLLKTIPFVSAVNETVYHPAAAGLPPEMSFAPVLSRQKSF